MANLIYLDHAAATPLDSKALKAMEPFFAKQFYNPSATYSQALEVRKALETARSKVGHWLGSRPSEIIFTAGGSEANNLAIHGVMSRSPKSNIVVSAIEHESVLEPAADYEHRIVKVQPDGRVDPEDLKAKIDKNTVMVSIMYANNEVGTVQPIREISKIIEQKQRELGSKIVFHTDAAQASNYLDLHVSRLGVDLMTINGGKIYGPKQSGALYVKAGLLLEPLVSGGGQERGLRSGTESVANAVGLAEALEAAQTNRKDEADRLQLLRDRFFELVEAKIPGAVINGSRRWRLPNNVHLTFPGHDNERLLLQLEQAGILAAAGSACSASSEEPSHVLKAMGVSEKDAQSSLRFTMGRSTNQTMVEKTVENLAELLS